MNKVEYEKNLIERILASMKSHGLEECAYGVFLTGSFGRGEVTYDYTGEDVKLLSDVEIGVVYKSRSKAMNMINAVTPEFEEELNCMTVSRKRLMRLDNFNNAVIEKKYKTLFMYDLVNGSKTIWGEDFITNADIPIKFIDYYEGKRIVANRIGELIYTRSNNLDDTRWKAKVIAAIGTAYLLLNQKYKCSYHEQLDAITTDNENVDKVCGVNFSQKYKEAFAYLRSNATVFEIDEAQLREYVKNINELFNERHINKQKVNTASRNLKYIIKAIEAKQYNLNHIENRILEALLNGFIDNSDDIEELARLWFVILY